MKKILVTGATGQLGSVLTPELRDRFGNDRVIAAGHQTAPCDAVAESGLRTVKFVREDVRSFVAGRPATGKVDLVVANPPRSGLGKGVAAALRSWGAARVILVSCDPPTLARDLKVLVEGGAYTVERIIPVDLFPQTAHIETVVLLTRS